MIPPLREKQPPWEPARPCNPRDFFISSDYAKRKPFVPSYIKYPTEHNMFLLLANEYQRLWKQERDAWRRSMYPAKKGRPKQYAVHRKGEKSRKMYRSKM